ncbi:MAG: macrolide ABC transporter ATP-binding protein [Gracilibacter sp. BRH_c7a]|nr:MAG: macrolide ABC transporter ATP-binding protein [Gracilibacter sp. BRH_c7a]
MPEILNMQNICKSYYMGEEEIEVLHDVNLTVSTGDFLSILGPSGSGKSTMMNIIGCLDVPSAGKYLLSGHDIEDLDEIELAQVRNKEIGFIFQNFQLLPRMTARQNVELPLIYSGLSSSERKKRSQSILERIGLSDKMKNLPTQLSGGQQQRVAIARALVTEPTILLADEPTGALDQKTGTQVIELFEELNRDGRTIIMITHDQNIARHASRVVNILDGYLTEKEVL